MALTLEWARELGRKCGGALYEKQNGSGPGSDLIASDRQVEGGVGEKLQVHKNPWQGPGWSVRCRLRHKDGCYIWVG